MTDRHVRVLSVFGTRPEAVKLAPVIQRLARTPNVESQVCVTAQHREMLDPVLRLFGIRPQFDLEVMEPDQSPAHVAAAVLTRLETVLRQLQPDWVLLQGDTTTVLAAALLAYFRRIPVAHVEAGLRTGDKWQPFPEEINRRVAGAVADLHFAPTEWARQNLLREGVPEEAILVTGNPVIDALQQIRAMPYDFESGPLAGVHWDKRVVLVTLHRREHFGPVLEGILRALRTLALKRRDELEMVYPVHLNPHVHGPAHAALSGLPNVHLVEPLDYLAMVHLLGRAYMALTDSGGIQEEAPAVGTPVLVLREKTERPEALRAGTARLAGTNPERILAVAEELLDNPQQRAAMASAPNPFGDGHAAERIAAALVERTPLDED